MRRLASEAIHIPVPVPVPVFALVRVHLLVIGLALGQAAAAQTDGVLEVRVIDPRAFGHVVGDVLTRSIVLEVPTRLRLVEESVPATGRVGFAFELKRVERDSSPTTSGTRQTLRLHYQLFHAPTEARVLDLPTFTLRFEGTPRAEEHRIDFAPVGVSPLAPTQAVLREGLGKQRPDAPSPRVDTTPQQRWLAALAALALLPLLHLFGVYVGWPWLRRRARPFTQAQRGLRRLADAAPPEQWLAAWRALHAALDTSAGRVVHAAALDAYLAEQPRFAALRGDLRGFFARSEALFFGNEPLQAADRAWLRAFCRRCADVERGAA